MGKVMIEGFQCERCKHIWTPRSKAEELPTICPKCKSPYWNKPRKSDSVTQAKYLLKYKKEMDKE
jgi:hypothetical protein